MSVRKSNCTPERWERILQNRREYYQKNREKEQARVREYRTKPGVRERERAYDAQPKNVAARKTYEEKYGKERKKRLWAEAKADPAKLSAKYAKLREWRTGVSTDQFDALMVLQKGRCAVCEKPFTGDRKGSRLASNEGFPCIDHCHDGGGPRGLLCPTCNSIEGYILRTGLSVLDLCNRLHTYLSNPPFGRLKTD